jgi:hypothetical protein
VHVASLASATKYRRNNCQYSTDKDFWRVNNIAEAIIINVETIASALLTWQEGGVWFRVLKIFTNFYFFKLILF